MNITKVFSVFHSNHKQSVVKPAKEKENVEKSQEVSSPNFLEIIANNVRDNILDM